MTERICLRCDWAGETDEPACPRCGAPLYRLGAEPPPAEPILADAPPETPDEVPDTHRETAREARQDEDEEELLPPVGSGERGRWQVIALALTLTAVVAFVLTRGGEPDPAGSNGKAPAGPAGPSPSTEPAVLPTCSDDPPPSLPFPEPSDAVPAATADYLFQGSLESSIGTAPKLVAVEEGSSVFTVDAATGTTVLRFAGSRGLALRPTTGIVRDSAYTIELLFRFDFVSRDRKVIDFDDGSADAGLYVLDGCLTFLPRQPDALTPIAPNAYVQVVLTRDPGGRVTGYLNGIRQFAFEDRGGLATVGRSNTLRFFADDHSTTGEYSSGAVSQIRLFDRALTENDVSALACSELAIADATFACRAIKQ